MAIVRVNGADIYYEDVGPRDGEPILFSHGLLYSSAMFRAQVDALKEKYRVVSFDHRGQGKSEKVKGDSIPIETNYEDALALIAALELAPCHFAGLSMGGFVGLRIAARKPELLRSLMLLETSAEAEPLENVPKYKKLNLVARMGGLKLVVPKVMPIMFGKTFLADDARKEERDEWRDFLASNDRSIFRAVNGVIERDSVVDELSQIKARTLIVVGDEDVATVPAKSKRMHEAISGSQLVTIPEAGHSSSIEQPARVTEALETFLAMN